MGRSEEAKKRSSEHLNPLRLGKTFEEELLKSDVVIFDHMNHRYTSTEIDKCLGQYDGRNVSYVSIKGEPRTPSDRQWTTSYVNGTLRKSNIEQYYIETEFQQFDLSRFLREGTDNQLLPHLYTILQFHKPVNPE